MKTHQVISVLLASLFINVGLANAQSVSNDIVNGVKLRGNGTVDDTQSARSPVAAASVGSVVGVKRRGDGSIDDTQPGVVSGVPVAGSVKLRGDGSVDDTQPGMSNDFGPNDTPEAKLAKLERQSAKREAQRERALAGLAENDPKRAQINARFDRQLAQLAAKKDRIEARGIDDTGRGASDDSGVRREDRREDRRADRREDRREDRVGKVERTEKVERAERAERTERAERVERADRVERAERSGRN